MYIQIKEHLDSDPKMQRFIHNRILFQTSDTIQYADYKRKRNQSLDSTLNYDLSFYVIDKLRKSYRRLSFSRPQTVGERSPYIYQSLQSSRSPAVKNIQRKIKNSKRNSETSTGNKFEYHCKQYKFRL